jgi:hypothetical protein
MMQNLACFFCWYEFFIFVHGFTSLTAAQRIEPSGAGGGAHELGATLLAQTLIPPLRSATWLPTNALTSRTRRDVGARSSCCVCFGRKKAAPSRHAAAELNFKTRRSGYQIDADASMAPAESRR